MTTQSRRPSTLLLPASPPISRTQSVSCLSLNPALQCNICHCDASHAVLVLCGHAFCWSCIYQWFETQSQNLRESSCPVCGSFATANECIPIYNTFETENQARNPVNSEIPERPSALRNYRVHQSLRKSIFERLDNGIENCVEFVMQDPYAILETFTFIIHAFGLFLFNKVYSNLEPINQQNRFQVDMLGVMHQFCIVLGLFPSMFLLHALTLLFKHFVDFLHGFKEFFFFLCIMFASYIFLRIAYFVYKTFQAIRRHLRSGQN